MTEWYLAAFVTFLAGMFAGFKVCIYWFRHLMRTGHIDGALCDEIRENYRMAQRLKVLQGRLK